MKFPPSFPPLPQVDSAQSVSQLLGEIECEKPVTNSLTIDGCTNIFHFMHKNTISWTYHHAFVIVGVPWTQYISLWWCFRFQKEASIYMYY